MSHVDNVMLWDLKSSISSPSQTIGLTDQQINSRGADIDNGYRADGVSVMIESGEVMITVAGKTL